MVATPPGPDGHGQPRDPRRVRAVRRGRGLPDGRRAGDRRARLRHRDRRAGRRDRGAGELLRAGGQAAGRRARRHRRHRGPERAARDRRRGRRRARRRARPRGAGRARAGHAGRRRHARAQSCWTRWSARPPRSRRSAPSVQEAPLALVRTDDLDAAVDVANAFAPEHLELACADAEALVGARARGGLRVRRRRRRRGVRRLRRRLEPRAADRRRGALLGTVGRRRVSAPAGAGNVARGGGAERSRPTWQASPARRDSRCTPSRPRHGQTAGA